MNILFIGKGLIAKKCLVKLYENDLGNYLCGILGDNGMINLALKNNLDSRVIKEVSIVERNEKFIEELIAIAKPDLIFSIQYPWIISSSIIKKMDGEIYNLHNAKLPEYRGHNTISHEILNEEKFHYSTIHKIDKNIDMGIICAEDKILINSEYSAYDLWLSSHKICTKIFIEFIQILIQGKNFDIHRKILKRGKYYGKMEINNLKQIKDFNDKKEIFLKSKAFYFPPHEPAYIVLDNLKIYMSLKYNSKSYNK
tara:strand:- start:2572 stop:3333 length:762 start_codon:yes stop_codon:yes gene_type:complete